MLRSFALRLLQHGGNVALYNNTTGNRNTATGVNALGSNTTGSDNTTNGNGALYSNTTGNSNTATGGGALFRNTAGDDNTANGSGALYFNTTGSYNTANGLVALYNNTTGGANTANGAGALQSNTTGPGNVASGFQALMNTTGTGSLNSAFGYQAGTNQTTGTNNVYIGAGMVGRPAESNTCYIASIFGQTTAFGGLTVYIDSDGKLGTNPSSKRFKEHIKPMDKASEAILALKPVTFPIQKRRQRHVAIWFDRRGSGRGEPGSGGARQERRDLQRAL